MNSINDLRLTGLFKAPLEPVTIIGCGAVGSKIAVELARIGVPQLTLWDGDIVESHNLCNQAFFHKHIGMPKVKALEELLHELCSIEIEIHNEYFEPLCKRPQISETVILAVDSMKARHSIIDFLKSNIWITKIIETRMGIDECRVYTFTPTVDNYAKWELTAQYDDSFAEVSACGTELAVGATSSLTAAIATWCYMHEYMGYTSPFEVIMGTAPLGIITT